MSGSSVPTAQFRRHSYPGVGAAPLDAVRESIGQDDVRDATESDRLGRRNGRPARDSLTSLTTRFRLRLSTSAESTTQQVADVEIYFGTKYGSAEQFARALAHDMASQRQVGVTIHDLDSFDEATFARQDRLTGSRLFVLVVSTHFAGAPSPSAERFRDWINDLVANPRLDASVRSGTSGRSRRASPEAPPPSAGARSSLRTRLRWLGFLSAIRILRLRRRAKPFAGMQFAVFGIGDSVYLTFNAMGKFVDAKLKHLGATRYHALALGDCSNDLDCCFHAWKASLMDKLPPRRLSLAVDVTPVVPMALRTLTKKSFSASNLVFPSPTRGASHQKRLEHVLLNVPESSRTSAREVKLKSPSPTANLCVVDKFGRRIRLRFHCRMLQGADIQRGDVYALGCAPNRTPSPVGPAASGPRTPRVALFDCSPFAAIVPVACVGFSSAIRTDSLSRRRTSGGTAMPRSAVFRVKLLNPEATYTTVSTLAIFPQNKVDHVAHFARTFGYDLDAVIELYADEDQATTPARQQPQEQPFPTPCTVRTALTEFLEVRTVSQEFLRVAAGFVATLDEHKLLETLASSDGFAAFRKQIVDQHKGVLDLLAMVPTLRIPLEVFVNIAQPIKPRYFTIASSPRVSPHDLEIAISFGRQGEPLGLAVSFFEQILASAKTTQLCVPIRGFISSSRFRFLDDGVSPMVFIVSGVGFAAIRAILQERIAIRTQHQRLSADVPKHLLFLGTTNEDSLVFRDDLRYWEQQMLLTVHYAFSNDRNHGRRYVQDAVVARVDEIFQAVKSSHSSRIFVCGRAAMVCRIREIFDADQIRRGNKWFDSIHKSGRFIEEGYN